MIEIKTYSKPKKTGGSGGSSSSTKYISGVISEAEHAGRADKAKRAEVADQANYAGTAASAQNAAYASEAGNLHADAEILQKYLSLEDTVDPQVVNGMVIFAKGLISNLLAQLKGGASFGSDGSYSFDKKGNLVIESAHSRDFDEMLQNGFALKRNPTSGKYTLSISDLIVWGRMVINTLETRKKYAIGGNVYLSGASSKIQHVEKVYSEDGETVVGYKCYILKDDGTMATQNGWVVGDQALCQTFDIEEGVYQNVSNQYYWRLVTQVSEENVAITEKYIDKDGNEQIRELYEGQKFAWVVLSKDDCDTNSGIPASGDTIVMDGHRLTENEDTDYTERTNVLMLEATGSGSPRIIALTGIVDYKHETDNEVFILSPQKVIFTTEHFEIRTASGAPITFVHFMGPWVKGTEYHYYDQVSHANALWTCIVEKGKSTTDEPTDGNVYWRKEMSGGKGEKGEKGDNGEKGDGVVMAYKNATSRPEPPVTEDLSLLTDGWSRTPQKGGSYEKVSNVSYGNYSVGNTESGYSTSEWSEVSDSGETWRKSPAGLSNNGWALMKVSFTTNMDNADVRVVIKAYSETNFDFIQVHELDREITGSTSLRKNGVVYTSGNGVEGTYSFTSVGAGQHFFYVSYCKDSSQNANGDYGLFRLDLSENLVSMPSTVWMSQAVLKEGKAVLPWSTPVQITGDDAYRVVVSPSVLIFDTDENGSVAESSLSGKTATIRVYQGDKDVSNQFSKYDRFPSNLYNCNGSLKDLDKYPLEIQVTEIETQDVTDTAGNESTISKTNGFLEFFLTNGSANVTAHVDVQVNVAKFTGQMVNTNKRFSNTLTEVGNRVNDKMDKFDLTEFKAEITQTAREISLSVSEKSIGRRNLLVGSAFRRQGEVSYIIDSHPYFIRMNDGYGGTNCAYMSKSGMTQNVWCGAMWNPVTVKPNTKYTFSMMLKVMSVCDERFDVQFIDVTYNSSNSVAFDTLAAADKMETFGWTLKKITITTPSLCTKLRIDAFIRRNGTAYMCRPMLEEGENYNGWTLSEQDYDYVGGNLLDNARTLDKSGTLITINDTVIQNGYGTDSACIKNLMQANATLSDYKEVLRWNFGSTYLVNGNDYIFSFVAKADVDDARVVCYMWSGDIENSCDIFTEGNGGTWDSRSDGNIVFILSRQWKRYWVHWRPKDGYATPKEVIIRHTGNKSTSASTVYVTQPKLEIGATMTEWTERKSDLVDKASLKAAGILVDAESVTLYGNQVHIKKNKTDANDTVLIDNKTGKVSAGLIDADKVVANGIKTQELEAQHLKVTGNSRLGIFEIHKAAEDERDEYTVNGDSIKYSGSYMFPDGKTEASGAGSFLTYKPMFIRQGAPDGYEYMRLGHQFTEWDDGNISGGSKNYFFVGAAARYVCSGDKTSCTRNVLPVALKYNSDIAPAAYIYSVLAKDSAAFAIYTQAVGTVGERLALQTNGAIRGVEALNIETIYISQQISSGIGAARCVNTAEITIRLPINPVVGQKFYVLQEDTGKVNITGDSNHQIILFNKGIVTTCNSNTKGQISIFIWSGNYWFGSFFNAIL